MFSFLSAAPKMTEAFSMTHHGYMLHVVLKRRQNAKRLTMRVRDGEVHATAPASLKTQDAEAFIAQHFDWVKKQLDQDAMAMAQLEDAQPAIWYRGVLTPVVLCRDPNHLGRSKIITTPDQITIHMAADSRLRPARLLENWLKTQARQQIKTALDDVLPELGQAPVPLSIRDQKTRWGSCSTTRRLSFNWRLIMAPPAALHYVVVHEAVHLIHHDHSSRFWGKVAEMMPDYRHHKDWLNSHQQDLFANLDRRLHGLKPQYSLI